MARITDEDELRRHYGEKLARSVTKELDRFDRHCRAFIAASPFCLVTTSGPGGLDITPRGDPAGFVVMPDECTLLLPDRPGNNRLDTLTNLLSDPRIGLIFMIPTVRETLRVRGEAEIRTDDDLRERVAHKGILPATVIRVTLTCAYFHCAKSILRSGLWQPETWPEARPVATMSEFMATARNSDEPFESDEDMIARYRKQLY